MKSTKIITYTIAGTLLFGLILANVVVSGSLSTTGEKLREIEVKKQRLAQENQALETKILTNTSLNQLAEIAQESGFVKPDSVLAVHSPQQTVAYQR